MIFYILTKGCAPYCYYPRCSPNNMKRLLCSHQESAQYKCPVVSNCGIGTRSWGGRAGGHSVSWHKPAAQAPWRHVSHHRWESADRRTAGMWGRRWRNRGRGDRQTGCKRCVTSGSLPSSAQDNNMNAQAAPTCAGGPQQQSNTARHNAIFTSRAQRGKDMSNVSATQIQTHPSLTRIYPSLAIY